MTIDRDHRAIATLAGVAVVDFALGSLVQLGIVRRLPDPPIRWIDSRRVMTSPAAYPLGIPDAPIALGLNALIAGASVAASRRTGRTRRLLDRLIAGASIGGAIGVVRYAIEMVRLRRACAYCIVAGAAMLAIVPIAVRTALRDRSADS
jgi:uncharacterized membrane protein